MPLPGDLTTITVTSTYPTGAGSDLNGYVTFTPSAPLIDPTGRVIIRAAPVQAQVTGGAMAPITLLCTDNANIQTPTGAAWHWIVTEKLDGAPPLAPETYLLPHTLGASVDLSELSAYAPAGSALPAGAWFDVRNGYGATGNGASDDTVAIDNAIAAAAVFGGAVYFPAGTYATRGLVVQNAGNLALRGDRGAVVTILPPTVAAPDQGYANLLTLIDCPDVSIEGLTFDGRRDELFPLIPLAANAAATQASVQVAHGASATLVVGQQVSVLGGWTVNAGGDQNLQDQFLTIQSITPGAGSANDTVTFTANLANTYHSAAGTLSDGYGPYAANGAYITCWQNGNATVAGLTLQGEDQQNGIHAIGCARLRIAGCEARNLWESGIRFGTHNLTGLAQNQGCNYAAVTGGNVVWHCYDQGIGAWCSSNVTITGNVVSAAGWAGICLTGSDHCTVSANVSSDNTQLIPNGPGGYGVAVEGALANIVSTNQLNGNQYAGVLLTALGTLPFGSPGQLATTVASNNLPLPAGTIGLGSIPAGWAGAGQFTVMSSAGAQQIAYTGVSGDNLTGCTGGVGTLYSGSRAVQYPLFTANGAILPVGSRTTTISSGTLVQVGGHYSIVDGPRTERITVTGIAGNVATLAYPTSYQHADKCQIGQAVAESNQVIGNSITGGVDAGIKLASAIGSLIDDNQLYQIGLRGIDGVIWGAGGCQPPYGSVITKNRITAPDSSGDGAAYSAIAVAQCSDVQIVGNRCGGALYTQEYYSALYIQALTDSVVSENVIADTYGVGMRVDVANEWPCKRVVVSLNQILRCGGEGMLLYGGQGLQVLGNTIEGCAPNSGPGYGGGLDVRGVQQSTFAHNNVVNNGHGGVTVDNASIGGNTVYTSGNVFDGNQVYDDGDNYDVWSGAHQQQGSGFNETSNAEGPNTYLNNRAYGNGTNWNIQSAGNTLRGNQNYNPVGKTGTQPAIPASGTPYTNVLNADCTVYLTSGTVTGVAIGGQATGMTSGMFRVPVGQSITLTYSAAPTWTWFGD